jgi:hypothetical protein
MSLIFLPWNRSPPRILKERDGEMEAYMPENPTSGTPTQSSRDTSLIIGLVLAGVVALLILAGSVFLGSDQKGVDVTATQPSTESPVTD